MPASVEEHPHGRSPTLSDDRRPQETPRSPGDRGEQVRELDPLRRNCANCEAILGGDLFWLSYWDQMPARFCGANCWAREQEPDAIVPDPTSKNRV